MKLTVDIFLVRDQQILILQRKSGFWYLPGGFVEPGEDPELAIVRETKEESGLVPDDLRLLRVWSYLLANGNHAYRATYSGKSMEGDVNRPGFHRDSTV